MARGAHLFAPLSLFLVSMLARLAAIGRYVTPDELNWVYRSLGLRRALLAGEWQHTLQSGHPGVTTTWIGATAAQVQLWLQPQLQVQLAWLGRLQQLSTDNAEAYRQLYAFLNGGRLGVSLVISLSLVLVYLLSRKLIGPRAAFFGALLLAIDPFFAGLSGLLHVDGLLAVFALASLILALRAAQDERSLRMPAAAGVFTALAVLTKTPGLLVVGFTPFILLWPVVLKWWTSRTAGYPLPFLSNAQRPVQQTLVWGITAIAVALLLLPALWAAPGQVLKVVGSLSDRLIEDAVRPTFFMGQVALDHGPLYYPVVTLIRLSPVAFTGLFLALPQLLRRRSATVVNVRWLVLFAFAFLIAITVAAKKFDRYALPALIVFTLAGAWGLAQAASHLRNNGWRLLLTAFLVQGVFFITAWPHPLTAANWLVGGNTVARNVLPTGWGEDAGLAARQLGDALAMSQDARLFSSSLTGTAPFFEGEIIRLNAPNLTRLQPQDYILTLPQDRRFSQLSIPETRPVAIAVKGVGTATLQTGLDATAVGLPSFEAEASGVRFGNDLQLQAAGSSFLAWPQETIVGLSWQTVRAEGISSSYRLQLELVNKAGQQWLQREFALLNGNDHAPDDWPNGEPQTAFYRIQLPATLAPGDYWWVLRVFDEQGRQQAVYDASGAFAGTQAEVARIAVSSPPAQPALEAPNPVSGAAPIVGHTALPPLAMAGEPFSLEIWWQAQEAIQEKTPIGFVLEIDGLQQETVLEIEEGQAGQVYRFRPVWRLPLALSSGRHPVRLLVREPGREQAVASSLLLGEMQVEARERLYDLPEGVEPLQVAVGQVALLQDVRVEVQEQTLLVHVIWKALETTLQDYVTFMHLRDGDSVIGGDDRQPAPPTSSWAPGEIIVEVYTLPRPAGGSYDIALGLYDATRGTRLPLNDSSGRALADNQFLLKVQVP